MNAHRHPLPVDVLAELSRGNKIEAIKLLREATGLGLKESKDVIDQYDGRNPSHATDTSSMGPLPLPVIEALQRGEKIESARLLRKKTGLGLKEAKDWIDTSAQEAQSRGSVRAPGEVPRSNSSVGGSSHWQPFHSLPGMPCAIPADKLITCAPDMS